MNRIIKQNNKGIASIFGTVFILFLVIVIASTLFLSLYSYEEKTQESINLEQERVQEKIVLLSLSTKNVSGTEYLNSLLINNTGTIITRIRAIYIDNILVCDPTDSSLNPYDTYINPKDYLKVQLPNNLLYEPLSRIEVATERGIKSVEYEWILRGGNQTDSPSEIQKIYFGPLLLDFDKFYYMKYHDLSDPNLWKPGWSVENSLEVVWNVTVTNIDDRNLTINKYSGFTLVPNAEGAQKPWFIEPPDGQDTVFIPSNTTLSLLYIWDGPQSGITQSVYNQNQECRIFMSFFGIFHEKDGSIKPYGQTIPFEAVLLRDPQIVIAADPAVIAACSSMTSTITVTVLDVMGLIADNVPVNFTTTLGDIPSSATTDSNGVAIVALTPGLTPGTAIVTATAESAAKSTTVEIIDGTLTVETDPSTIAVDSSMTSEITARVTLNGDPLSDEPVTFTTNATPSQGTLSSGPVITNSNGYASVIFYPGTETGNVSITAEWGNLTEQTTIDISVGEVSIIQTIPTTITANSSDSSDISIIVLLGGNPVANEFVTFTTNSTQVFLSPIITQTDDLGIATTTLWPGTTAEYVELTVTWENFTDQTIIIIEEGSP